MGMARHVFLFFSADPAIPDQQANTYAPPSGRDQQIAIGVGPWPDVPISVQFYSGIEAPAHQIDAFLRLGDVFGDRGETLLAADQEP